MSDTKEIIKLYSQLADSPEIDFGWDKGLQNAKEHGYDEKFFESLPPEIWDYCAAVGNPFSLGEIHTGSTVVDLGCGAGIDLLISALKVGDKGTAIGIDITPKMVSLAKKHAQLAKLNNVRVLESDFENIDLEDESVDYVISNGAINLSSCKESVFAEIYRILKPNARLYFSDMIDISPEEISSSTEKTSCCETREDDWANCVAGTLKEDKLINIIKNSGFKNVQCTKHTHYTTAQTTQGANFKATKIPSNILRQDHWDKLFKTLDYTQVLWHQNKPNIELIKAYTEHTNRIIDVGCGASLLVDDLLEDGYQDISLLDTSATCLDIVKKRLHTTKVNYLCRDILSFCPQEPYDLWHDRAVLHFLVHKSQRKQYFQVLKNSLKENAKAIISSFAKEGEIKCAGLDILAYDEDMMRNELPEGLELIQSQSFVHTTPKGSEQKYITFVLKKNNLRNIQQ
ncbi:MAG: methyltransferase type 11 [Arcobacter sp.]|nr:MAG: methyltransferase type 11 [Arcobacter sp.]